MSSAQTSLSLPFRMNSFPLVPRHTVVFFPSRMKVKTSPYYLAHQHASRWQARPHLLSTLEEEVVWVDAVGDGAPNDGDPMKHERRFVRISKDQLAEDVEQHGQHEEDQHGRGNH